MKSPIEKEVAFYASKRSELLVQAEGKFVLVKGEDIIGIFDSRETALAKGYERFGPEAFLVQHISKEDEAVDFALVAFP